MNHPSLHESVTSLLKQLDRLPEGIYDFMYTPSSNELVNSEDLAPRPPLLVAPATSELLERFLMAYAHWKGSIRIGVIHCEGLPSDFWIY